MATKTNRLLAVCSILVLLVANTKSFLDLEELRTTNYGIDIVNEPVKIGQEVSGSVVQLRSKYGQQYQCSFPNQVEQEKQKEEEEKLALETGILQLLKPFQTQGCLFKTKDWWSYEFCYGKYIHGAIKGEVIYLGHFQSDFDWDNQTNKEQRLKSKTWHSKYHSQTYTNGSKCDLTGNGRRAEVRFFCEEGAADYISRIDEPETCAYIVSIYTARICNHPFLKPPTPKLPVPITCNPVLTEEQYNEYIIQVEAAQQEKERLAQKAREAVEAAKSDADDAATRTEGGSDDTESAFSRTEDDVGDGDIDHELGASVENIMKKTLSSEMKTLAGQSSDKPVDVKVTFKVVQDLSDIEDIFKEAFTQDELSDKEDSGSAGSQVDSGKDSQLAKDSMQDTPKDDSVVEKSDSLETPSDDKTLRYESKKESKKKEEDIENEDVTPSPEEEELMEEFDKELGHLKTAYKNKRDKFVNMKNKVRDSMKTQFDDIIEEAEEMYGEEIDKKLAFKQLAGTLDKLITKLEHTEKEIDNVDKELENFNRRTSKAGDSASDVQKPKGPGSQSATTKDGGAKGDMSDEDQVRVRVTKVKAGDLVKEGSEVPDEQRKQLEQTVKDGIIKAGLDTGGGKIQVKIITTGYTYDDDESMHIFSPEETSNFQNMIVAILGGSNEASKEAERQQKMEDNYSHVWGQNKNKKSKSLDTDQGI